MAKSLSSSWSDRQNFPWKGRHIFLQAAAQVPERFPRAPSSLLAPRSLVKTRTTSHLTTRLGIKGIVEFAGSPADVQCAIAELDLVVHASTTGEPVGQVIIEDGLSGMLFPMGDAQAMAEQYSSTRMEAAADRARTGACRYKSMKSVLKNSLDQQPLPELPALPFPPSHDNIRGAEYFE